MAETVTCLSGASTSLSTAVIVTVPVLLIEPAAMVSVVFALRLKSSATAGSTGAADTVSVTASLETPLSVAVTVVEPSFSPIDEVPSTSDTVGVSSSSVIVRVSSVGFATPLPPAAVAETVTCFSGASTSLSTAVIVTVPVLAVSPAAMVSVVLSLSVKSSATAGSTGAAETVSVTASLDTALSVAVTVVEPSFSPIDEVPSANDTVGVASSSSIVIVAGEPTVLPPWLAVTITVSAASATASFTPVTVVVTSVSPAVRVSDFETIV